jgi:hypothetical protein
VNGGPKPLRGKPAKAGWRLWVRFPLKFELHTPPDRLPHLTVDESL